MLSLSETKKTADSTFMESAVKRSKNHLAQLLFTFKVSFNLFKGAALGLRQEEDCGNPVDYGATCAEEEDR